MMRRLGPIAILIYLAGGSAFAQGDGNDGYDLTRLGLYMGKGGAIRCGTTASSTKVSCPGGVGDFATGQGIEIPLAGVAATFNGWGVTTITSYARSSNVATYSYTGTVPGAGQTVKIAGLADGTFNGSFRVVANNGDYGTFTVSNAGSNLGKRAGSGSATITSEQVVVTPAGILNGSTAYDYKIVLRGYHGELSVASPAGETTAGAATLGVNTVSISSCSRKAGVATCATSAAHNFQSGVQVDVEGTTKIGYNGAHQIFSTPSGTTFTFLQTGAADDSGTATGGTASVVAKNMVQWNMQQYTVLQSIIYRSKNGGNYSIAGIVEGMDAAFVDWGMTGSPATPAYIPTTPPHFATNGILAARITAIAGTSLTLDSAAAATVVSQSSAHDNTPVVLAGCNAIGAGNSGTLNIPATKPPASAMFNSPLDLYHHCNVGQIVLALASTVTLNEPLIMRRGGITIRGVGPSGPSHRDSLQATTTIVGDGYPMIYFVPGSFGAKSIENIHFLPLGIYQSAIVEDSDVGGGNVVNTYYINDYFAGGNGTMPGIIRGGFNKYFLNGGGFSVSGAWGVPEALQVTIQNSIGSNPQFNNLAYLLRFERVTFRQHGIEWNDFGHGGSGVGGYLTMIDPLMEDGYMPLVTFNVASNITRVQIENPTYADFLSGASTPLFQTGASGAVKAMVVRFPYCASGVQPLFEGTIAGVEFEGGYAAGCTLSGTNSFVSTTLNGSLSQRAYANVLVQASGTSQFYYAMDLPAAPASVVASAGGSVPIGTHCFGITANDPNGGETLVGPTTCAKTTGGNQTLTITRPTLPTNAVSWNPYWIAGGIGKLACFSIPIGTVSYVHSVGFACTNSVPALNTAGRAALGASGLSANQYTGNKIDLIGGAAPSVPAPALGRLFFNSSTKALGCLNSDGSSCLPEGGSVTHTLSPLTAGRVIAGNGGGDIQAADLTGDCSTSGTLATNCAKIQGNFLIHRELIAAGDYNNGVCTARYNTTITATEHAGANVRECQIPMADGDAVEPPPILLPVDWIGDVDVGVLFSDASTSGTVIFNAATACSAVNGTATDDAAFNTAQAFDTITLRKPASGQWLTTITGINTDGCTAGQPLQLKITRAKDSASGAANVRAYSVTYRTTNAR